MPRRKNRWGRSDAVSGAPQHASNASASSAGSAKEHAASSTVAGDWDGAIAVTNISLAHASVSQTEMVHGDGGQNFTTTVDSLLNIGPVKEHKERIEKTRGEQGAKAERARVAHNTLELLAAGCYDVPKGHINIQDQLQSSIAASTFYPAAGWQFSSGHGAHKFNSTVEIWCCTTLYAAQELAREGEIPPGVLNFASARNPGGGFATGAEAQEESIARSSGLYPCLTKYFNEFFVPHRCAESGEYTHAIIYSPAVPVFRDDSGRLLETPYTADFLTSPAPNLGVMQNKGHHSKSNGQCSASQRANDILYERSARVLDTFARHGAIDLVLGAWGCGVFRNEPKNVANNFKTLLEKRFPGNFRRIIFAVLDENMAHEIATVFGTDVVDAGPAIKRHEKIKQKKHPRQ